MLKNQNLGDVIYDYRPGSFDCKATEAAAPARTGWAMRPNGRPKNAFVLVSLPFTLLNPDDQRTRLRNGGEERPGA